MLSFNHYECFLGKGSLLEFCSDDLNLSLDKFKRLDSATNELEWLALSDLC